MKHTDNRDLCYKVDTKMEYKKWTRLIPYLNFKKDWEIKLIPPLSGAVVRFMIKKNNIEVSVYLDCYAHLGAEDAPYWEIYPDRRGNNFRCGINETDLLINEIEKSLNENEFIR